MLFNDKTIENFAFSYISNLPDGVDPHKLFAELEGISRESAKELCYKVLYSSEFINSYVENRGGK
jgi:hypothetical protein